MPDLTGGEKTSNSHGFDLNLNNINCCHYVPVGHTLLIGSVCGA